jgi:CMP-N-acetylneuraminic acid synthetase|tara:strand:+ start:1000 stop:1638 length:639 start_codon:yes stop_codon:yes gene_type:complete
MKIVSVILARGGSKEIPSKNIINVKGKPLIYYTIKASQESNVQETWVSTDCAKIKKVAQKFNANVLDRPKIISQDFSKSEEALIHFSEKIEFDVLVFIQPTSPLLKSKDINKGIRLILDEGYNSVFSVYKQHWIPRWTLDIKPINWKTNNRPMRQEVNEEYVENGAFYITTKTSLLKSQLRYSGKKNIVVMPLSRSFQIDTLEDLKLIQGLL